MSTFHLEGFDDPVPVQLPAEYLTKDQLLGFPAFQTWLNTLKRSLEHQRTRIHHPFHKAPFALKSITVQSVDFFGPNRIGFLKLKARIENENNQSLPGICFLRGGSVAVLVILQPKDSVDERWVVTTL